MEWVMTRGEHLGQDGLRQDECMIGKYDFTLKSLKAY